MCRVCEADEVYGGAGRVALCVVFCSCGCGIMMGYEFV